MRESESGLLKFKEKVLRLNLFNLDVLCVPGLGWVAGRAATLHQHLAAGGVPRALSGA